MADTDRDRVRARDSTHSTTAETPASISHDLRFQTPHQRIRRDLERHRSGASGSSSFSERRRALQARWLNHDYEDKRNGDQEAAEEMIRQTENTLFAVRHREQTQKVEGKILGQRWLDALRDEVAARYEADLRDEIGARMKASEHVWMNQFKIRKKQEITAYLTAYYEPVVKAQVFNDHYERLKKELTEEMRSSVIQDLRDELEAGIRTELRKDLEDREIAQTRTVPQEDMPDDSHLMAEPSPSRAFEGRSPEAQSPSLSAHPATQSDLGQEHSPRAQTTPSDLTESFHDISNLRAHSKQPTKTVPNIVPSLTDSNIDNSKIGTTNTSANFKNSIADTTRSDEIAGIGPPQDSDVSQERHSPLPSPDNHTSDASSRSGRPSGSPDHPSSIQKRRREQDQERERAVDSPCPKRIRISDDHDSNDEDIDQLPQEPRENLGTPYYDGHEEAFAYDGAAVTTLEGTIARPSGPPEYSSPERSDDMAETESSIDGSEEDISESPEGDSESEPPPVIKYTNTQDTAISLDDSDEEEELYEGIDDGNGNEPITQISKAGPFGHDAADGRIHGFVTVNERSDSSE